MGKKREYSNGEVTIVWEPEACIHSAICAKGLPNVFRPKVRPWIRIEKAETEDLVNQVKRCPSGALSFYMNSESDTFITSLGLLIVGADEVVGDLTVTATSTIDVTKTDASTITVTA